MATFGVGPNPYLEEVEKAAKQDAAAPIDLHQLLEDIKYTDDHIESLRKKRADMVAQYHTEKDKLDAHYSMVVDRQGDPGPTTGRY